MSWSNIQRETTKQHKRMLKVSDTPLDPPRDLKYKGSIISWKLPQVVWNISHFRIYKDHEYYLVREVPRGQTEISDNLQADRVFVSSFNAATGAESRKVLLDQKIGRSIMGERSAVIGIPGTVYVADDTPPQVELPFPVEYAFRVERAYLNAKFAPTTELAVDCLYSDDPFDTLSASRTWKNIFATNDGDLTLPIAQMQRQKPLTTFAKDPMDIPGRSLIRCDVKGGVAMTDMVVQLVGVVIAVNEEDALNPQDIQRVSGGLRVSG